MEIYGEVEVYIHTFLTLALDVGEWSLSRSLRKEAPVHIGREIG
jgi:hypothetical protein